MSVILESMSVTELREELAKATTRLQQVESERDKAEADAAVMRRWIWDRSKGLPSNPLNQTQSAEELLRNHDSAKSLLERLKEAEWLLVNCPNSCDPEPAVFKEWWSRRDAFLNPKPQDVK